MVSKLASIHIDMDSPNTLLRFWGFDGNCHDLDSFYEVAMTRALGLLRESGVHATFFCIGEELEKSPVAAAMVRQASRDGHEIANHTYSHPFALTTLDAAAIRKEVQDCSNVIRSVTGSPPVGFRSPGYEVNATVLGILEALGLESVNKERAKLEQRLLNAVSDLRLMRKEREQYRDQLLGLSEAILHLLKTSTGGDAQARVEVEAQLRSSNGLATTSRSSPTH